MNFCNKYVIFPAIFSLITLFSFTTNAKTAVYAESGFILTSIKPLQLIAADITQGVIESIALLPPGASPHAYALRPSDIKKIHQAKMIYWIGPQMEQFLQKTFAQYPNKNQALSVVLAGSTTEDETLHNSENLATEVEDESHASEEEHDIAHESEELQHEEGEELQHQEGKEHQHEEESAEHDEHQAPIHLHKYQGKDLHIWLSPIKALQIANLIKNQVIELYPQHRALLEANYQRFSVELNRLDLQLNAQFSPLKALGFIVFHDGYSRFIEHYQLNQIAAITNNPANRTGAKHLAQMRQLIEETQPACIFSEPQFNSATVNTLKRNFPIKIGQLDPLATDINVQQSRYISFMKNFARQFTDCLTR
ncbi:MAG: zinc ABC transporter substrate-binding protein ZnuA [Oceanospirillaceae bacterium]